MAWRLKATKRGQLTVTSGSSSEKLIRNKANELRGRGYKVKVSKV